MRRLVALLGLASCIVSSTVDAQQPTRATPSRIVLRAARLIDGTGAAPIQNAAVVIEGNRITAVGAANAVRVPPDARVIDLGDATLLPGFIDAHLHII